MAMSRQQPSPSSRISVPSVKLMSHVHSGHLIIFNMSTEDPAINQIHDFYWLVFSTHLKNISQLGWWHSQYMENTSHVPVTTNQIAYTTHGHPNFSWTNPKNCLPPRPDSCPDAPARLGDGRLSWHVENGGVQWHFDDTLMGFWWDFDVTLMGFWWDLKGILMGLWWYFNARFTSMTSSGIMGPSTMVISIIE